MKLSLFVSTVAALAIACGGSAHEDAAVPTTTTTAVAVVTTPPLFTGSFDVVSMTDGKKTLVVADMLKQATAFAGRMTYEMGADSFTIGMWQASRPEKIVEDDSAVYSEFCRASGTVAAHWEGKSLVLASTIRARAAGTLVRVFKKTEGAATTRNVATRNADCEASFTGLRLTFEILEKDASGPTRIRAVAEGVTLDLARGKAIASIEAKPLFDE